jgi:PAS domain S-box-containing protein
MKKMNKTKEELLSELKTLKHENSSLKAMHKKELLERKQSEDARCCLIKRLQLMFSSLNYSIIVVDENNRVEFINEMFCEQFELVKDTGKWIGYKSEDFIHLILPLYANPKITFEYIKKILADNQQVIGEEILMKDGRTYLADFIPLTVDGQSSGRMWVHCNITERKQYEELLKLSHERYTALIETTIDGFMAIDLEGNILEINESYCKMSGYSREQLLKMNMIDVEYSDSVNMIKKRIKEIMNKGSTRFEIIHKCANGSLIDLEVQAISLKEQKSIFNFFNNITMRKRTEEELSKQSCAIVQSPVSIIITDPEGNIEYANPKFVETSGYSSEQLIGKNPRILNSGYHTKEYYEDMWNTILSGKDWSGEVCNMDINGNLYWESSRISPIVNSNGDITNYVQIKMDITEKKKMVEELIKTKEKAFQSDKLKSEFLAHISHEIRSPMSTIINYARIIKEELESTMTPELREYLDGINSAGQRLIRTIDLFVNVSEMIVGTYKASFEEFDLIGEIIDKIRDSYTSLIKDTGLQINYIQNITEAVISGDKYSIYQIFANLVDNAIKFSKEGTITIKIDKDKNRKEIKVTIEDTGIGISEEFMSQMFQTFTQEDNGYSKNYEGNGLGLSLVKKYCDLNNITIAVESRKNIGTKFTLTFFQYKIIAIYD